MLIEIDPRDYIRRRATRRPGQPAVGRGPARRGAGQPGRSPRVNCPARLDAARRRSCVARRRRSSRPRQTARRQRSLPKQAATTQQDVDSATAALREASAQRAREAEATVREAEPVQRNRSPQAEAQVRQLEGQVEQAQAQLDQAELNLAWCTVRGAAGWLGHQAQRRASATTSRPGSRCMSLVTPEVWVTANFKETQLDRMRPGQRVDIGVDAYPGLQAGGPCGQHPARLAAPASPRFRPENATGNFVKIVQRVPVKIVIDSGLDPDAAAAARPLGRADGAAEVSGSGRADRPLPASGSPRPTRWLIARRGDAGGVHGDPRHHHRQCRAAAYRRHAVGQL